MDTSSDNEILLTLVISLLECTPPPQIDVLEALVQSSGQVEAAAELINSRNNAFKLDRKGKRKRVNNLESWLEPPSPKDSLGTRQGSSKIAKRINDLESWLEPPLPKYCLDARQEETDQSSKGISLTKPKPSASPSKPVANLMSILRQPPTPKRKTKLPRLPPLMLSTPALVAKHTPCTLHLSILPPDLACRLFYKMVDESKEWKRNKWWLFDRVVESPHRTSFYARKTDGLNTDESWQEAAQFWYNGRTTDPPEPFPEPMEEACRIVENIVNEEMMKRERIKLEWGDPDHGSPNWRANVAASNCYEGCTESVGFHSDQLTYLGPYPTIASLSLGTRRTFSLREVIPTDELEIRDARMFNIPLSHNSLTIMHASCQERFKHSIPPQKSLDLYHPAFPRAPGGLLESSNCRINITFRFYRPDFRPSTIPRCKCGIPTILRPDMKNRAGDKTGRYWWACYAGAQNEGKGCNFWRIMDMEMEGRGPCVGAFAPRGSGARWNEDPL